MYKEPERVLRSVPPEVLVVERAVERVEDRGIGGGRVPTDGRCGAEDGENMVCTADLRRDVDNSGSVDVTMGKERK